jgi:hypothetical protein
MTRMGTQAKMIKITPLVTEVKTFLNKFSMKFKIEITLGEMKKWMK